MNKEDLKQGMYISIKREYNSMIGLGLVKVFYPRVWVCGYEEKGLVLKVHNCNGYEKILVHEIIEMNPPTWDGTYAKQ